MANSSSVVLTPVALGLASPAGQSQNHRHLSPFTATVTATTTPSPYVNSFASTATTHWSSRPSVLRHFNLVLRVVAFILSFASCLSLAVPPPQAAKGFRRPFSFEHFPEFRYCISVTIIASIYSGLQLCKGIWDIAFKGFIIPDKVSDYITFFADQVGAYLLMSSSSVSVLATQHDAPNNFRAAAIASTTLSFGAFLAIAASALLAGYWLCKRIIW